MWMTFLLAFLAVVLICYVPGILVLAPVSRFAWSERVAYAPLVCVSFYGVASIVLPVVGVSASVMTLVLPLVLVGVIHCVVRARACRRRGAGEKSLAVGVTRCVPRRELVALLCYVLIGVVVTTVVFVKNLDGATSFYQAYDNGSHLNTVRVFLETGNYSSFNSSAYAAEGTIAPVVGTSGFYPAAWHALVAMAVSVLGVPLTLGVNAVNATLLAVVFPLSMCSLIRRVFNGDVRSVLLGAVVCVAFTSSVWDFVIFGPLYPMLLSYSLVPAAIACFLALFGDGLAARDRAVYAAAFVLGCAAIALSQPSGIFLMAVFLAPFCVWQAYRAGMRLGHNSRVVAVGAAVAAAIVIALIWMLFYLCPFFQGVVSFTWKADTSVRQAVADVFLLSLRRHTAQPLLAIFVLAGIVSALRDPSNRWIVAAYFIAAISYVVCVTSEGTLKHVLGGFWYTDFHRLAANVAIIAMPLAVLGLNLITQLVSLLFDRASTHIAICPDGRLASAAFVLLSCAVIFYPSFTLQGYGDIDTSFGNLESTIWQENDQQGLRVLDVDEAEFVRKALELIPDGSLIINYANDGSGFAYALYGANTYYRNFSLSSAGGEETPESVTIRTSLDEISQNEDVGRAVSEIGARYVLLLDQGDESERPRDYFWSHFPDQWEGILSIDDETPGFSVVLSQGDMRLYEID